MSFIFKKLSVILCCLFGLISINPATLAKPGDYLVYSLGKDEENVLMCGGCYRRLRSRSGQFCCPNHCASFCAGDNMWGKAVCKCAGPAYWCVVHQFIKNYGPFCFINYENGGNFDTVFENAKKSNQLYCAYCMANKLNGNFSGKISFNVPETLSAESEFGLVLYWDLQKFFKLDDYIAKSEDNRCDSCVANSPPPCCTF